MDNLATRIRKWFKYIDKIKVYRLTGYIFAFLFGILGCFTYLFQGGKLDWLGADIPWTAVNVILAILLPFVFNIFLWIGLILLWRADRNENPPRPSRWLGILKGYAVFSLLMLPVAVIVFSSAPSISRQKVKEQLEYYRLPADFVKRDLSTVIHRMSQEETFQPYFRFISNNIEDLINDTYVLLDGNKTNDLFREAVLKQQREVEAIAALFASLSLPQDYLNVPGKYPKLSHIIAELIYEKFKVTILAICYKASYDSTFELRWNKTAAFAFKKIANILKHRADLGAEILK